ncbi:unnamed protein product [Urochloa humidicola]
MASRDAADSPRSASRRPGASFQGRRRPGQPAVPFRRRAGWVGRGVRPPRCARRRGHPRSRVPPQEAGLHLLLLRRIHHQVRTNPFGSVHVIPPLLFLVGFLSPSAPRGSCRLPAVVLALDDDDKLDTAADDKSKVKDAKEEEE